MRIVLIQPNVAIQRSDFFTTGILYMPIGLAYIAASLRQQGHDVKVIDAIGEAPFQMYQRNGLLIQGLRIQEITGRVPQRTDAVFIYASQVVLHEVILEILRDLRRRGSLRLLGVLENTQAVTGYSLGWVYREFLEAGADVVVASEGEERVPEILRRLERKEDLNGIDGIAYRKEGQEFYAPRSSWIQDLDRLTFPAWDLFPLLGYWRLRYGHGPVQGRYLPLLTSRGCPYPCRFCVIPESSGLKWRSRSPKNVVDEMAYWQETLGVREFHFEDLNPTVNEKRTLGLCRELQDRKVRVRWKIVAGTKIETIRTPQTLTEMYRAGCRYLSFSPESGSERMLKMMNKPFPHDRALEMTRQMRRLGIRTQACFVLGFPGEEASDLKKTKDYVRKLTMAGLDEIALFVISPLPGSELYRQGRPDHGLSGFSFSPTWRQDYRKLNVFRKSLYLDFLRWKLQYQPRHLMRQPINFLRRNFETKMEMAPYRALRLWQMSLACRRGEA